MSSSSKPALELSAVTRVIDGTSILGGIDWTVNRDDRWVVLGPNGSGKTTLIKIASMWLHPSAGSVSVLGQQLGRTDVRTLRAHIGFASASMADMLRPDLIVRDVVMTARNAALEPWWHSYTDADRSSARAALGRIGISHLADRRFGVLSSGERQKVLLARALSIDPGLILLDEPTAALDLGGREALVQTLAELAADPGVAPIVLVTHHVEEIPDGFTHVLMIRDGLVSSAGPISETLTESNLSDCFAMPLRLERRRGRWAAWAS